MFKMKRMECANVHNMKKKHAKGDNNNPVWLNLVIISLFTLSL